MGYKIRPALLIIDFQNCFVSTNGSFAKLGYDVSLYQKITPVLKSTYQKAKSMEIPIIFSQAIREESGVDLLEKEHQILPQKRRERIKKIPLCTRGSQDAKMVDELTPDSHDLVINKRRDSIFQHTELEIWLRSLKADTLIFTGVDTAICVESSLRDAFNRGWDVILLSDATASLEPDFYKTTLLETEENFGFVMKSEDFFKNLKKDSEGCFILEK